MGPDMDVVMAIREYVKKHQLSVDFKHVKGHADRSKSKHECSRIEQLNIDCDEDAEICVQSGQQPQAFKPLPGSKCMVQIRNEWVTSRLAKAIQYRTASKDLEDYLIKRLKVDETTVQDIDRKAIGTARSQHRWARTARTSKLLTGWMPVGHNWRHHGAISDKCPCCGEPDETFKHLFSCQDGRMIETRQKCLKKISKVASETNIVPQIRTLAIHMLKITQDPEHEQPPLPHHLQTIWDHQQRIGLENFALGWLSQQWRKAAESYGSKDPEGEVAQLLTLIWDGWCEPIWETRNNILKKHPNPTELMEHRVVRDKLRWFKPNKREVLPERFRFLAEFSDDELKHWRRRACRARLKHLELGKKIYEIECRQRYRGQMVITDWLIPT